jgi:hypothetical protein
VALDIEKIRSIGVPHKKRGSHVYSEGGNSRTAVERVREYAEMNPQASQRELERQARIEACGARNQETFANALKDGLSEASRIVNAQADSVAVAESAADAKE